MRIPTGEFRAVFPGDEERYNLPDNVPQEKRRESKETAKVIQQQNDELAMLDRKDQMTIFRNKIDRGHVDEDNRKDVFKDKAELSKTLGNAPKTFKKKKPAKRKPKRRKIADSDDDSDEDYKP